MSWLFSQVLVAEYLGDICSDGEQSVQLNGKPIQQAYCAPDKMTDFLKVSQSGMTFKPLTENLGKELLMLYLADFHAKTLAQQEKAQELTENDQECGEKWHGSFVKYDPDTSLWKTHQCSLLGGLEEFLETWPQWGLMQNGECWERQTLEQTIRGTESGFVPNGEDKFHTPNTTGLDGGSNSRKALKRRQKFPTPISDDANHRTNPAQLRRQTIKLSVMAAHNIWPTPNAWDGKRGPRSAENLATKKHQISLVTAVKHSETTDHLTGGQLNPTWVEWLMGWPLEWTELKPLETDKSPYALQQHGES